MHIRTAWGFALCLLLTACGGGAPNSDSTEAAEFRAIDDSAAVLWDRQISDTADLMHALIDEFNADNHTGWSVVVHGTAREAEGLLDVMHDEEIDTSPWADGAKLRVVHITPDHVTGRAIGALTTKETS